MDIVAKVLSLEVTEDCNLSCSHCLCGEKRKVTMSDEVIKAIFNRIKSVEELVLTGGEVFLAYEQVKRVLEIAKEMNVELLNCSIVTNGCIYDERIYKLLDEYFGNNYAIFISNDVFHDNSIRRIYTKRIPSTNPSLNPHSLEDILNNTMMHMRNSHFEGFKYLGNKIINVGRAKVLLGDKYPFEVCGYFYDYYKDKLLVGPIIFISADGYITDGNDEISHYKEGSLGNVLDGTWENSIINGGIHMPVGNPNDFWQFLDNREEEYQKLKGISYIIEDKKMKVIDIKRSHAAEEELDRFLNFLATTCEDGITAEKILSYDFSQYPYDLSVMEHMDYK